MWNKIEVYCIYNIYLIIKSKLNHIIYINIKKIKYKINYFLFFKLYHN